MNIGALLLLFVICCYDVHVSAAAPASDTLDREPSSAPETFTAYLNTLKATPDETGDACCAVRILDLDPLSNHGLNSHYQQSTAAKNDTAAGKGDGEVCCDPRIVGFIENVSTARFLFSRDGRHSRR
jgi:hypothetical protein